MELKTEKTIQFFRKIAEIPRESGNEEAIAEYLCEFAQKRGLQWEKDEFANVVIKKEVGKGLPIILQAHTDMVCEKEEGVNINFDKDPISVIEENGFLCANQTTLGADNGIGMAQILTVLDSNLPVNIEAIFTVSEETSMVGAINLDLSKLKGKMLLNLDGFEENVILLESAGFQDILLKMRNTFQNHKLPNCFEVSLSGLEGGHSGFDIAKNRGNSSKELAKLLMQIPELELVNFVSGTKFNVIPSSGKAIIYTNQTEAEIQEVLENHILDAKKRNLHIDSSVKQIEKEELALSQEESKAWLKSILEFPDGVFQKNERGEVTTSTNLGVVDLRKQEMKVGMRSSRKEEEISCFENFEQYAKNNQFEVEILGAQPSFRTKENAQIVERLLKTHPKDEFQGRKPQLKSMHVTVEVGFFQEKNPDLQIAIISPKIQGAHTTKECVEIASIERNNRWIENFLLYKEY